MNFNWFRRKDEELDAEIRSHLDEAIRDRLARGDSRSTNPGLGRAGDIYRPRGRGCGQSDVARDRLP
jgi:hypothetical protein